MQVNKWCIVSVLLTVTGCKSVEELIGDSNIYYDDAVYLSPLPEQGSIDTGYPQVYSQEDLEQNRNAIPDFDTLVLEPMEVNRSETALFPQWMNFELDKSNPLIGYGSDFFQTVHAVEPSIYDADTLEFVWGPYDNDYTQLEGDQLVLYIRYSETNNFAYQYAVLLLDSNNVSSLTPVIWGGSNPDPDNARFANGVLVIDFTAAEQFTETYYQESTGTHGRFSVLYSFTESEDIDAGLTLVASKFRNYVSPSNEVPFSGTNIHGDIFRDENVINFARFTGESDVHTHDGCSFDCADSELESWSFDMVYRGSGQGRGEAKINGGDAVAPYGSGDSYITKEECWNDDFKREYLQVTQGGDSILNVLESYGESHSCSFLSTSISQLSLPNEEDIQGPGGSVLASLLEGGLGDRHSLQTQLE